MEGEHFVVVCWVGGAEAQESGIGGSWGNWSAEEEHSRKLAIVGSRDELLHDLLNLSRNLLCRCIGLSQCAHWLASICSAKHFASLILGLRLSRGTVGPWMYR